MEMMFLIVKLGYGSVVMPEKYKAEQCQSIANTINATYSKEAICIPTAVAEYCKFKIISRLENHGASSFAVTEKVCE